jgi:hypothetical protein
MAVVFFRARLLLDLFFFVAAALRLAIAVVLSTTGLP